MSRTRASSARNSAAAHWRSCRSAAAGWKAETELEASSAQEIDRRDDDREEEEGEDNRSADLVLFGFGVVVVVVVVSHGVLICSGAKIAHGPGRIEVLESGYLVQATTVGFNPL